MKQHSMNVKETNNGNCIILPSDTDRLEANSRIIQRLTAVGIIKPENITQNQQNEIFELCGLSKIKIPDDDVVTVTVDERKDPITLAEFVAQSVLDKLKGVTYAEIKDKKIIVTFD